MIESVAIRLGVSPTPVREALARLAGEQLVSFRAYVGYSALPPLSLTELRDLFEAREVIECAGAVRACERATDADLARLREIDAHIRAGHYGKERYSEFVVVRERQPALPRDAARRRAQPRAAARIRRAQLRGAHRPAHARARRPRPRPDLRGARRDHRGAGRARRGGLVAAVADHARESHQRLVDDLARMQVS